VNINKSVKINASELPFRQGVGMMILDKNNRVFVGKRLDAKSNGWQMPQGGIDLGETPSSAALREMEEEIGSGKGEIIAESKKWYSYRVPDFLIPRLWGGKYCGQRQKWFLIRFKGDDSDININTEYPEFDQWKWIDFDQLLADIIPIKLKLYEQVVDEFESLLKKS
jgi:putative (di)nucleoside polyphosphate hydrolase